MEPFRPPLEPQRQPAMPNPFQELHRPPPPVLPFSLNIEMNMQILTLWSPNALLGASASENDGVALTFRAFSRDVGTCATV